MFGFVKGLLASESIMKGGMAALDKAILTKEERLDYELKFLEATLPMNRTRRIIAMTVCFLWAINSIIASILLLMDSELFQTFMQHMLTNITAPFSIVMIFYFKSRVAALTKK